LATGQYLFHYNISIKFFKIFYTFFKEKTLKYAIILLGGFDEQILY